MVARFGFLAAEMPSVLRGLSPMNAVDALKRIAFKIAGIPHVAIISSDGIVRWQGHSQQLDAQTVKQLVDANRSALKGGKSSGTGGSTKSGKGRWANETPKSRGKK